MLSELQSEKLDKYFSLKIEKRRNKILADYGTVENWLIIMGKKLRDGYKKFEKSKGDEIIKWREDFEKELERRCNEFERRFANIEDKFENVDLMLEAVFDLNTRRIEKMENRIGKAGDALLYRKKATHVE